MRLGGLESFKLNGFKKCKLIVYFIMYLTCILHVKIRHFFAAVVQYVQSSCIGVVVIYIGVVAELVTHINTSLKELFHAAR